jgi:hypothetical protein
LANLVAKSLISADASGTMVQYRLFKTTYAYAMQKLIEIGEFEDYAPRRHHGFCSMLGSPALSSWATRCMRRMLEARRQPSVLAVHSNEPLRVAGASLEGVTSAILGDELRPADWHCHAAGEGAKGPRLYDWARVRLLWSIAGPGAGSLGSGPRRNYS